MPVTSKKIEEKETIVTEKIEEKEVGAVLYKKVDDEGNFLPYFGYTSVAMSKENQSLELIEEFLNESPLGQYYAALPADSYHMTLFNIWSFNRRPQLPAVQSWINQGNTIPRDKLLPKQVFGNALKKAQTAAKELKDFSATWRADFAEEFDPESNLHLLLTPDDEALVRINKYNKEMSNLFKHDGQSELGYHLTLAYRYRPIPAGEIRELNAELYKLNDVIRAQTGDTIYFYPGEVNWFKDMRAFPKLEEEDI